MLSPIVTLRQMLMSWCRPDFWILYDILALKLAELLLLPVLGRHLDIQHKMMSPIVAWSRAYAACFVTFCCLFRFWIDV